MWNWVGAPHHGAETLNLISGLGQVEPGRWGAFRKRLPGEGPGVSAGPQPCTRVHARQVPRHTPLSCHMPTHTCAHAPPCCVSTVHALHPTMCPHAHTHAQAHTHKSWRLPHVRSCTAAHPHRSALYSGVLTDYTCGLGAGVSSPGKPNFYL